MRVAYFDCASGISGDMALGALVDAGADLAAIQAGIDSLGLPGCRLVRTEVKKQGFRATQIKVEHEPEHKHRHLHHIAAMIDGSNLTTRARELAKGIFERLAEAEAKVHGTTVDKVHFHEVGAADSIADIVGAAIGFDLLEIERVVASPVATGQGYVEIAHGRCSIPAPATGELLRGIPLAPLEVEGELTTPTGAAILATVADTFGPLPAMVVEQIGYGAGQRDFPQPNILRVLIGERNVQPKSAGTRQRTEAIVILETNIDNASGELVGHAAEQLWTAGALDVSLTPIQMKKSRPGVLLAVQARPEDANRLEAIMFLETPSLGVRRTICQRTALTREPRSVETPWGNVAGKIAYLPDGSQRFTPEYEACRELAERQGMPVSAVVAAAQRAFASTGDG